MEPLAHPPIIAVSQDVALPYMQDERFPDDQLFLVAEADFRFYRGDCLGDTWESEVTAPDPAAAPAVDPPGPPPTGGCGGASRPSQAPEAQSGGGGVAAGRPPPRLLPRPSGDGRAPGAHTSPPQGRRCRRSCETWSG